MGCWEIWEFLKPSSFSFLFFELGLTRWFSLAVSCRPSCLGFLSAEITDMYHHAWSSFSLKLGLEE